MYRSYSIGFSKELAFILHNSETNIFFRTQKTLLECQDKTMRRQDAFTLIELLFVFVVMAILASIAIPAFSKWLPGYRLRSAASDLFSQMQATKMQAIKNNSEWAIVFDPSVSPGRYFICSDDGANNVWDGPSAMGGDDTAREVDLSDYGSGVDFGHGTATAAIGTGFGNEITFAADTVVFNSRGMINSSAGGYVYLQNSENASYGAGALASGVIQLKKWDGTAWD